MKHVYESEVLEELAFAKKAAEAFAADPKLWTYTEGEVEGGAFFAVRWGLGDDCVLVLKLSDVHHPTIYAQQIRLAQNASQPAQEGQSQ